MVDRIDNAIVAEEVTKEEITACIELVLSAEIRIPSFHILLCRYYMLCWNDLMKEALNQDRIDTKELSTLLRDMNKIKYYLSTYAVNV